MVSRENFKNLKHHTSIFEEILVLSIISSKCKNEDGKVSKEEEPSQLLKILELFKNI